MFQGIADDMLQLHFRKTRAAATDEQATEAEEKAGEAVLAIMFLKQSCPTRFGEVTKQLQNDFLKGKDNYPTNDTAAYAMLSNWHLGSRTQESAPPLDSVAYAMDGQVDDQGVDEGVALATVKKKRDMSKIVCNNYGKKDMYGASAHTRTAADRRQTKGPQTRWSEARVTAPEVTTTPNTRGIPGHLGMVKQMTECHFVRLMTSQARNRMRIIERARTVGAARRRHSKNRS